MSNVISETTRTELESVLKMLMGDVRAYRTREQQHLSDPTNSVSELMRTVGAVTALKTVESVIGMLCELYQVNI